MENKRKKKWLILLLLLFLIVGTAITIPLVLTHNSTTHKQEKTIDEKFGSILKKNTKEETKTETQKFYGLEPKTKLEIDKQVGNEKQVYVTANKLGDHIFAHKGNNWEIHTKKEKFLNTTITRFLIVFNTETKDSTVVKPNGTTLQDKYLDTTKDEFGIQGIAFDNKLIKNDFVPARVPTIPASLNNFVSKTYNAIQLLKAFNDKPLAMGDLTNEYDMIKDQSGNHLIDLIKKHIMKLDTTNSISSKDLDKNITVSIIAPDPKIQTKGIATATVNYKSISIKKLINVRGTIAPTKKHFVEYQFNPLAKDVNPPIKEGATFSFVSASEVDINGVSEVTYEMVDNFNVSGVRILNAGAKNITWSVSGFETKKEKELRIAKLNAIAFITNIALPKRDAIIYNDQNWKLVEDAKQEAIDNINNAKSIADVNSMATSSTVGDEIIKIDNAIMIYHTFKTHLGSPIIAAQNLIDRYRMPKKDDSLHDPTLYQAIIDVKNDQKALIWAERVTKNSVNNKLQRIAKMVHSGGKSGTSIDAIKQAIAAYTNS